MLTFEAGMAATLPVDFLYNGQPAIPDQGTAVLSVYAPDGSLLDTQNLTTGPTDHRIFVTVAAEFNTIATSFSRRRLKIDAERNGEPFTTYINYRLVPAIQYTVTPADVRNFLGVNESELPDGDVDLNHALLEIEFDITSATMAAALTSGEEKELRANDAILYKTALNIIPSLSNRVAQQESDGTLSFRRNTRKDFSDLKRVAEERLSYAISVVNPVNDPGYNLITTTAGADPITGA